MKELEIIENALATADERCKEANNGELNYAWLTGCYAGIARFATDELSNKMQTIDALKAEIGQLNETIDNLRQQMEVLKWK